MDEFSLQNVIDGDGVGIAITGMLIVFCALTLIGAFIALLPHTLRGLNRYLPATDEAHHRTVQTSDEDDEVLAAVALALHARLRESRSHETT